MFDKHTKIVFDKFRGLFDRGREEACPQDYLLECTNMVFDRNSMRQRGGQNQMRNGAGANGAFAWTPADFFQVNPILSPAEFLISSTSGNLYYTGLSVTVPILTIGGWFGAFNAVQVGSRVFIMPVGGVISNMYVWDIAWSTARQAGNNPPGGFITVAVAGGGIIEAGQHIIGCVFTTTSGFITGVGGLALYNVTGAQLLNLTTIPTGPVGEISNRRIVSTKVIYNYDGNPLSYEFFFIPGAVLNDNTTVVLNGVNFADSALVDSADEYRNQLARIPSSRRITLYNGRLVVVAPDGARNSCYVSKRGEPESIDAVDGILTSDPPTYRGIEDVAELRGNLYIFRDNVTQVTQDDDTPPSEWKVITVDKSRGIQTSGVDTNPSIAIGQYGMQPVPIGDNLICRASDGLYTFNGVFGDELTWAIRDKIQNESFIFQASVVICPERKIIAYGNPAIDLYIGDYSEGLSSDKIRWAKLNLNVGPSGSWKSGAGLHHIYGDGTNLMAMTFSRVVVWDYNSTHGFDRYIDAAGATQNAGYIPFAFRLPYVYPDDGWLYQWNELIFRAEAGAALSGSLVFNLFGLDDVKSVNTQAITVGASPGIPYRRWFNFVSEAGSLRLNFTPSGAETKFEFKQFILAIKRIWQMRPK